MSFVTILFTLVGTFGIILNITVSIAISRDVEMQNPTCKFMVQLAIADAEFLIGITWGPPLIKLTTDPNMAKILSLFFAYLNATGFHTGGIWLVLIALTRWFYFAKPNKFKIFFTKRRTLGWIIFFWTLVHGFYLHFFIQSDLVHVIGESVTYQYDQNSTVADALGIFEGINNASLVVVQTIFNLMTIVWIIKIRRQTMSPEIRKNYRKEVKLYIQCAVDWLIYTTMDTIGFICIYSNICNAAAFETLTIFFILNVIDCAILYLCFNTRLRSTIIKWIKKNIFRMTDVNVTLVTPVAITQVR